MLGFDGIDAEGSARGPIFNGGNPGIVEGVKLTGVTVETSDNTGSTYIKFAFEDENGGTVNHFEFDVDPNSENAASKQQSQLKRLKHIVTKYVPEGTVLPQANTFPEMYTALVALLNANNFANKVMRLKTVYNQKGYVSVPKYVPFIESADVAATESKLSIKSIEEGGIDRMTKPAADNPADLAYSNGAGAGTPVAPSDAPF